jgi:hypothetical protein
MHSGKTVFKQLLQHLPRYEFNLCVSRYSGEHWAKKFSTYDQFLCLAYAQMAGRESLRDIETCLNSHQEKLYHIGFRGDVSRTTLADANERRDWRIPGDVFHYWSETPANSGHQAPSAYPEAKVALDSKGLILAPSPTHIIRLVG